MPQPKKTNAAEMSALLDSRKDKLVYSSSLGVVAPIELTTTQWHAFRLDVVREFPDFTLTETRKDGEFVLRRSGRVAARGEYLLRANPKMLTMGAGREVDLSVFERLYKTVWASAESQLHLEPANVDQFDIAFTWDISVNGNPYKRRICPAILKDNLASKLIELFVFEFDSSIKFQLTPEVDSPIAILDINSPLNYEGILERERRNSDAEIRVKLGLGLTANQIPPAVKSFNEMATSHWNWVTDKMVNIVSTIVNPLVDSLGDHHDTRNIKRKKPRQG